MALKVTKSLQVQRDNNSNIFVPTLTSTKPTGAECDADLVAQINAKIQAAQGQVDELTSVLTVL